MMSFWADRARAAFEGFVKGMPVETELPSWEELPEHVRDAWEEATAACMTYRPARIQTDLGPGRVYREDLSNGK